MKKDAEKRLLELGFDTDLIAKIESKSLTLSSLKQLKNKALLKADFTQEEADFISSSVKREPIASEVLEAILFKSGEVCCYCADGNSTRPFHIHHIEEYHISRNNEEENLALVCPNNHADVHLKKIPVEKQRAIKRAWESVWHIAQQYASKGVSFPFGAFEVVDYSVAGSITEVFSFSAPQGSVCLQLAKGLLSQRCLATLKKENRLILAGGSGSGKTTLAKGIAAYFKDAIVFKYVVSDKSSIEIAREIAQFLTLAQKELVLIIDDANTKLQSEQLESILLLSSEKGKVIIVNTRNTFHSDGNLEQHFTNCVEHISWSVFREEVATTLLEHETEIIDYLNTNGINNYNGNRIGYGVVDSRLNRVVEKYSESTETVWQFIFMLGGGLLRISNTNTELRSFDRFDLIVLFISINQIAKVEHSSSIEEILDFYRRNSILKKQSAPTAEWLKRELDALCAKRTLVNVRGRYKTVHREFAKAFIETAYSSSSTECSELLDEIFKNFSRAREIMILWSWLKHGKANGYTKRWSNSLTIEQWLELSDVTVKHGLGILQILAEHLHTTTLSGHSKIAHEVFKGKANAISELINKGENGTLYYFNEISTTLKYHCSEVIKPIMDAVAVQKLAILIKDSEVEAFQYLPWLFDALAGADIDWVIKFKNNFKFQDFEKIIERNEKGRIDQVCDAIDFYRRYIGNIKRSEFKTFIRLVGMQMRSCDLHEIRFPLMHETALLELMYFPDDIKYILGSLDMPKITNSFESATPTYWGSMFSLCYLSEYADVTFAQDFIDGLDVKKIVKNIEKHYEDNLHEFRIIMYQLAYASAERRIGYAKRMQPFVEKAMVRFPDEQDHQDILKAFYHLDETLGTETCQKLKKNLPEKREMPRHDLSKIKVQIEENEKSGHDYNMSEFLIQRPDDAEPKEP